MNSQDLLLRTIIALDSLKNLNIKVARKILESADDPQNLSFFDAVRLGIKLGVFHNKEPIGKFLEAVDTADRIIEYCKKHDVKIVDYFDPDFPKSMCFEDHPYLLYYRGNLKALDNPKRATIVGTRYPNEAGKKFAYDISTLLSENGYTVISGLAPGCDTQAHRAAMDHNAQTVAFIPSGVGKAGAQEKLAEEIVEKNGLIISEFSPLAITNSKMFINRDQLQAASTNEVFVSEFTAQSGTVQTLRFAYRYKKPIYTLKALTTEPEFNGYKSLLETSPIKCQALDWDQLKSLIEK